MKGGEGLAEELQTVGLEHSPIGPDETAGTRSDWIAAWEAECNGRSPLVRAEQRAFSEQSFGLYQRPIAPMQNTASKRVQCVLVGIDDHFNFLNLMKAAFCIRRILGCHFVATNLDPFCI